MAALVATAALGAALVAALGAAILLPPLLRVPLQTLWP
jgi:hypothetical protein